MLCFTSWHKTLKLMINQLLNQLTCYLFFNIYQSVINWSFIMFARSITWTVAERKTILTIILNSKCTDNAIEWLVLLTFRCQWQGITLRQAWGAIIAMCQVNHCIYIITNNILSFYGVDRFKRQWNHSPSLTEKYQEIWIAATLCNPLPPALLPEYNHVLAYHRQSCGYLHSPTMINESSIINTRRFTMQQTL